MSFNPGGGGGISGATDVALSNPASGDALTFDGIVDKWQNASLGDTYVDSTGVRHIERLTQAAYNALGTPDADTLYVVIG